MWNSNSLTSWLLARSGHDTDRVTPALPTVVPPGWSAGTDRRPRARRAMPAVSPCGGSGSRSARPRSGETVARHRLAYCEASNEQPNSRHCVHEMNDDFRCFHSNPPRLGSTSELTAETPVQGVVVCIHVFGLGVYLPREDAFGHVNVTAMGVEQNAWSG